MAGVTETGIELKTSPEIRESLASKFRGKLGNALNTTPDGVAGRIIDSVTPDIADLWEAVGEVYSAQDVTQAEGDALLSAGGGLKIKSPTATRIAATVTLGANVTLAAGSAAAYVDGRPDLRGTLVTSVTSALAGDYPAIFDLDEAGAIPIFAGTFNEIATPVAGWTAINNATDAETGQAAEDPEAYRARILRSQAIKGSGTLPALQAALEGLDGVVSVRVFENASSVWTDLPPHSFEALIHDFESVDNGALAQMIFDRTCGGFTAQGASIGTATATVNGEIVEYPVRFSRPNNVTAYITATVKSALTSATIKQRLAAIGNAHNPGESISAARTIADLFAAGCTDVVSVSQARTPSVVLNGTISIDDRGRADYDSTRITITVAT